MELTGSVICTNDSSLLRQQLVVKKLENRPLRRQVTAKQQAIEELEPLQPAYNDVNEKIRENEVVYCNEKAFPVDREQHYSNR